MEELKSAHRPFKVQNASVNSLTDGDEYYRIRVNSLYKSSGSDTDAVYDIRRLFPNSRADLLDGEWHAYLEEFILKGFSQWGHPRWQNSVLGDKDKTENGIRVCLPDLVKPSKDFIMTENGIQPDHTLARVPKTIELNTSPHVVKEGIFNGDGGTKVGTITFTDITNINDTVFKHLVVGEAITISGHTGDYADNVNLTAQITTINTANFIVPYHPEDGNGDPIDADLTNEVIFVSIPLREGIHPNDVPVPDLTSVEVNDAQRQPVFKLQQHSGHTFGRAIDSTQLFQGQLRVVLKGEDNKPITSVYSDDNSLTSIYGYVRNYEATIVFMHKKKYKV